MTRDTALKGASEPLTQAYACLLGLDGSTVEQAARAAWTPTGPALPDLIDRITARRAQRIAA